MLNYSKSFLEIDVAFRSTPVDRLPFLKSVFIFSSISHSNFTFCSLSNDVIILFVKHCATGKITQLNWIKLCWIEWVLLRFLVRGRKINDGKLFCELWMTGENNGFSLSWNLHSQVSLSFWNECKLCKLWRFVILLVDKMTLSWHCSLEARRCVAYQSI